MSKGGQYVPTRREIAKMAAKIREEWDDRVFAIRAGVPEDKTRVFKTPKIKKSI